MEKSIISLIFATIVLSACHRPTFDEQLKAEVDAYNEQHCPRQADEFTIETSREYNPKTRELIDNFDIIDDGNIDTLYSEDVRREFRDNLLKNLKYDINIKTVKDSGVIFIYRYKSNRTHKLIFNERFTKEDYQ